MQWWIRVRVQVSGIDHEALGHKDVIFKIGGEAAIVEQLLELWPNCVVAEECRMKSNQCGLSDILHVW